MYVSNRTGTKLVCSSQFMYEGGAKIAKMQKVKQVSVLIAYMELKQTYTDLRLRPCHWSSLSVNLNPPRQKKGSPKDPKNPCVDYPTEEHSSYADCDDDFVRRSLPPGLAPFWAVDNISLASNNFTYKSDYQTERLLSR